MPQVTDSPAAGRRLCKTGFGYSPFTAADEKIPLSMVHVNSKPQHLVFWSHTRHPIPKQGQLPVESFRKPRPQRVWRKETGPKPGIMRAFVRSCPQNSRLDLVSLEDKARRWCIFTRVPVRMWTNWDRSPRHGPTGIHLRGHLPSTHGGEDPLPRQGVVHAQWPARRRAFEAWRDAGNFDEAGSQEPGLAEPPRPR
jgi:hypothetical protein